MAGEGLEEHHHRGYTDSDASGPVFSGRRAGGSIDSGDRGKANQLMNRATSCNRSKGAVQGGARQEFHSPSISNVPDEMAEDENKAPNSELHAERSNRGQQIDGEEGGMFAARDPNAPDTLGRYGRSLIDTPPGTSGLSSPSQTARGATELHVSNIPRSLSDDDLWRHFAPYGIIRGCRIIKDAASKASKGFGFVRFATAAESEVAMSAMHGRFVGGEKLIVRVAASSGKRSGRLKPMTPFHSPALRISDTPTNARESGPPHTKFSASPQSDAPRGFDLGPIKQLSLPRFPLLPESSATPSSSALPSFGAFPTSAPVQAADRNTVSTKGAFSSYKVNQSREGESLPQHAALPSGVHSRTSYGGPRIVTGQSLSDHDSAPALGVQHLPLSYPPTSFFGTPLPGSVAADGGSHLPLIEDNPKPAEYLDGFAGLSLDDDQKERASPLVAGGKEPVAEDSEALLLDAKNRKKGKKVARDDVEEDCEMDTEARAEKEETPGLEGKKIKKSRKVAWGDLDKESEMEEEAGSASVATRAVETKGTKGKGKEEDSQKNEAILPMEAPDKVESSKHKRKASGDKEWRSPSKRPQKRIKTATKIDVAGNAHAEGNGASAEQVGRRRIRPTRISPLAIKRWPRAKIAAPTMEDILRQLANFAEKSGAAAKQAGRRRIRPTKISQSEVGSRPPLKNSARKAPPTKEQVLRQFARFVKRSGAAT